MIRKSLLCFVILFGLHCLLVFRCPASGTATHRWQSNVIKTQQFLYAPDIDTAMVGTSLSAKIISDSIPSVHSLSFSGCSVEDGLRIISKKEHLPRLVLVETNLFLREGSPNLFASQTNRMLLKIRKQIPSLREQYQSVCLLFSFLKSARGEETSSTEVVDSLLRDKVIERRIKEDTPMDETAIQNRLQTLRPLMQELEGKGVRFVFFEMPVNERLRHTKRFEQTRAILQKEFPQSRYVYLPADTATYMTTDGLHLNQAEQRAFSHHFKEVLSQYQ